MDDEMKRFLQDELKRDANHMIREAENDPEVADMKAPPELREKLFEQIRQYEQEKEHEKIYENLPEEYKELVDLGMVYKRKRKAGKYVVLAAVLVSVLAVGVTSFGGPERVFKELKWKIGGREQINVDSEDENILAVNTVEEENAYQAVQDEFQIEPVRMYYLPKQIKFAELTMDQDMKMAQFVYEGKDKRILIYQINVNYKQGSVGFDVEDKLIEESVIYCNETPVEAKHYFVEQTEEHRWIVNFEYRGIQYFIAISNVEDQEIKKIVKNLNFF